MTRCSYCGKDNKDTEECLFCCGCGARIREEPAAPPSPAPKRIPYKPKYLDLSGLPGAFEVVEGFSRLNWKPVYILLQAKLREHPDATREIVLDLEMQWMERLRDDLGGGYHVSLCRSFVVLSELPEEVVVRLASHGEEVLHFIAEALLGAWDYAQERLCILLFTEPDDYFQYIAYLYPEGVHPQTSGLFVARDLFHIAAQSATGFGLRGLLAHELTHLSLAHLPMPRWLDEGLATHVERRLTGGGTPVMNRELRERHGAFWTKERAQEFWAGTSFYTPGDSVELSYNLAEILVNILCVEKGFKQFVRHASYVDAGQTAALDTMKLSLGDALATFLGPGDWRPRLDKMAQCKARYSEARTRVPPDSNTIEEPMDEDPGNPDEGSNADRVENQEPKRQKK